MSKAERNLQALVDAESRKPFTHSILLSVRSGDGRLNFESVAGEGTPDSPYFVASISKMYTATVVMQLVDENRLALDDPIARYLTHLPLQGIHVHKGTDFSGTLTVRQLLHQTSGLADYFAKGLDEDFKQNRDRFYSVEDVLDIIRERPPFAAPDSGRSHYSDTNFQLLGALIEVVTETKLASALHERIFARLGMANTYLYDHTAPPAVAPLPFYNENTPLSLPLAMTSERGTGAAVSTMADTHRFLRSYFDGELFN